MQQFKVKCKLTSAEIRNCDKNRFDSTAQMAYVYDGVSNF